MKFCNYYNTITKNITFLKYHIYDDSFYAEVYELLVMEKCSESSNHNKFVIKNNNTLSAEGILMHKRHELETISEINRIIT